MDAYAMITLAKDWKPVPAMVNCSISSTGSGAHVGRTINDGDESSFQLDASNCSSIEFLEHVTLSINLTSEAKRGDFSLNIRSNIENI